MLIPASVTRNQLCDLLLDLGPFGVKTNWEDADPKTDSGLFEMLAKDLPLIGKDLSTNSGPKSLGTVGNISS